MAPFNHRKPEPFSGENPDDFPLWLQKFNDIASAQEWGDKAALLKILPIYFSGHAYELFCSLDAATQKNNYDNAITAMKAKLGIGENPLQWRLKLHRTNRIHGESADAFAQRLGKIVTHGYPDLENGSEAFKAQVIEQFILGQPQDIRFHLLKKEGSPGLQELISSCKVYEMASEIALGTNSRSSVKTVTLASEESDQGVSEFSAKGGHFDASGDSSLNVASSANQQSAGCFRCGQPGHLARDCYAQSAQGSKVRNPICFNCKKPGHISRFCTFNQGNITKGKGSQYQQSSSRQEVCQRCGNRFHNAGNCRTNINIMCQHCKKKGHDISTCRSRPGNQSSEAGKPRDYPHAMGATSAQRAPKNVVIPDSGEEDWD